MLTVQYAKALPDIKFNRSSPAHAHLTHEWGVDRERSQFVRMATIGKTPLCNLPGGQG